MTERAAPKYFQNFQAFVVNKFIEYDERFNKIEAGLASHSVQILNLTEKVDRIDERTAFLPKLYSAVDAFMKEIQESRQERVFINQRIGDHEDRIVALENAAVPTKVSDR